MIPPVLNLRSPLADGIERFLAHRRALGRRYDNEAWSLRLLDRHLVAQSILNLDDITPPVIEDFLCSRPRPSARSFNLLLGIVRSLFRWMVGRNMLDRSPVVTRPRRVAGARVPVLLTVGDARRLLLLAGELPDTRGTYLRGPTHRMTFALLYGLGLRLGEVRRLLLGDVDGERELLVIRQTKFGKSRLVPYGPMMALALRGYIARSADVRRGLPDTAPLLSLSRGVVPSISCIRGTFRRLLRQLQLPPGPSAPRLHDLRHSFAVGTLLGWYQQGLEPSRRLHHLSTFMGHAQPESTAVYLTITDALLSEAGGRFERYARGGEGWLS